MAQLSPGPVARFSFNNSHDYDEVSGSKIKMPGANFTDDRFGNPNHAVFVSGNVASYINLGTGKALKHSTGSISLWVNMEHPIWSGIGTELNPILITKNCPRNDFYEAYALYYMLRSGKIVAVCALDSTFDTGVFSRTALRLAKWQHIVLAYNNDSCSLYLNGRLERTMPKNFKTTFLESDSVIIGSSANTKNRRSFNGNVDDVEFYDRVLTAGEVKQLYDAPNPRRLNVWLQWLLWLLAALAFVAGLYLFVKFRIRVALKKQRERLELANKILETELRVNRALMNPHFVFNSLSSLQNFIMSKDYRQANNYLIKFSKLMRKLLESNISNLVSLEEEIELLRTYIELENERFEKGIDYAIEVDSRLVASVTAVPVMLVQPFVENAIWHGLLKKEGEKLLYISFIKEDEQYVKCVIDDNGVGRNQASPAPGKRSLATVFVVQRLELLNRIHSLTATLSITDKPNGQGTTVTLLLPVFKKQYDHDIARNYN